jgi:hypothetical protein
MRRLCTPLDSVGMINLVNSRHFDSLPLGYHLVLQIPARSASKLCHHIIAVAEKVDIKVDVVDWLMR